MKIYTVIASYSHGTCPEVETSYTLNLEDAQRLFNGHIASLVDEFATVLLESFDPENNVTETLEAFEGMGDDDDADEDDEETDLN